MNILKPPKKSSDNHKQTQMKKTKQFDFLMQSLQRQKFSNHLKQNSKNHNLRHSIKPNPHLSQKWHMTNSIMVTPTIQSKQQKQLDKSPLIQTLLHKVKNYLSLTKSLFEIPSIIEQKIKIQAINIAFELMQIISQIQQDYNTLKQLKQQSPCNSLNTTMNLITGISKSLSSSLCSPNILSSSFNYNDESNTFIKKIQNLQQQKRDLQNIISNHQKTNIKMFIKLNQGESQIIQSYKKQLSLLFQKYKKLQKYIKKQSQKYQLLQIQYKQSLSINHYKKQCQSKNHQLNLQIINLKQIINQQNDYLSYAINQLQKYKLQKYQYNNISPILPTQQSKKSQKNKQSNQISQFPGTDLIKSVLSQTTIQTTNKYFTKNTNITHIDLQPSFNNISIKSTTQNKIDDYFFRVLVTQASALQSFLKK